MKSKLINAKAKLAILKTLLLLFITMNVLLSCTQQSTTTQTVPPVLEFPEIGLDDTTTYRGYTTRFYQDSEGNTLQIYLNQKEGRIVHLWADAANESISFTARNAAGNPAKLTWDSKEASVTTEADTRFVEYRLHSDTPVLELGHFILNTMRLERDFQHFKRHTLPFDAEPFIVDEFTSLIENLEKLPSEVRDRHFGLLDAGSSDELRLRLLPQIKQQSKSLALVEQPTFDGENHLSLEMSVVYGSATIDISKDKISIQSLQGQPIKLTIKVGTDSTPLTPIRNHDIFNNNFFHFYERAKAEHDSIVQHSGLAAQNIVDEEIVQRFKRLQRQVKSMELMSSQEKLMAGLPNYATYFGRDMMMSALMLEPVLKPAMLEHVIANVLKKLLPNGEVSHEEGLGSQAIRENAAKYNKMIEAYL
ncbi:MAG: hypothetical protein ACE5I1_19685, partial [bacterium]